MATYTTTGTTSNFYDIADSTNSTTNSVDTINYRITNHQPASGQQCNESLKHDHAQKAVFHGMKSAFRMVSSGKKGVDNRQFEPAARIAANVGVAYLQEKGLEYDREASFEYIADNILTNGGVIDSILDMVTGDGDPLQMISDDDLEAGIDKAWQQIDQKEHHADGARTAIAIAEAYLNETFEVQ